MRYLFLSLCLFIFPLAAFAQMEESWSFKEGQIYRLSINDEKVVYREKATAAEFRQFANEILKANNVDVAFQKAQKAFSVMAKIELSDGTSWRLKRRMKTNFLRELSHLTKLKGASRFMSKEGYGGLTITPFPSSGEMVQVKINRGHVHLTLGEETTHYQDKDFEMERWLLSTGRNAIGAKKLTSYYKELSLK